MKTKQLNLKPQDIVLCLKLLLLDNSAWRMTDVANDLFISQSEVSMGLDRLSKAKLVASGKKKLLKANFYEFLIHGLKYAFPATLGPVQRGLPTAYSAEPVASFIKDSGGTPIVWPWSEGEIRGETISPLYQTVPESASKDSSLYQLLALTDTLRVGRAREQKFAVQELKKLILES